jgi:hypothetical protein
MAEYHDTGATKQENYAREKHQINQDFNKEVKTNQCLHLNPALKMIEKKH